MTADLEDAEKDLLKAFDDVREDLGKVFVSFETLRNAGPYDDVYQALEDLESVVKDVRTGGLIGSGANSHRRSREKWVEAGGTPKE